MGPHRPKETLPSMALLNQIWTLMLKNFRSLLLRHYILVVIMAFILPIFLGGFFSFAKNLFVPPAVFGFADPSPVKTLSEAFRDGRNNGRDKVVLVNYSSNEGQIGGLLADLEKEISQQQPSMNVVRVDTENDIVEQCRSSLRGVTTCFCAVVMRSSPNEGSGGIWNYTIRTDSEMSDSPFKVDIDQSTNPGEVYLLPIQRAIDTLIASASGKGDSLLSRTQEFGFTDIDQHQRAINIREVYGAAIYNFMGVVFITAILWITYHLTGFIATERESGMSNLIDAMMPVKKQWHAQAARIIANHVSFSMIYAPAWIITSIIIRAGVFSKTSVAVVLFFNLLAGLALASISILFSSFFKKAQLSGITAILATFLLGVLAQSLTRPSTVEVAVLSALFAPCCFVYFMTYMGRFEKANTLSDLSKPPPDSPWNMPGYVFFIIIVIQIFVYPLLGALVEKRLYGTTTVGRKILLAEDRDELGDNALQLHDFTKIYQTNRLARFFSCGLKPKKTVVAVESLTLNAGKGQILALLGANGSGKSTTLDAIAGLNKLDGGSIAIDGTGGLGIAPQKDVLWDDMTVEEHLTVFNRLKAPRGQRATKQEITDLIASIDLTPKRKALAKTLSGGQKRKLQLGMMLTGGSAVCCVDEVSSGLDPLSRRKIWDILLAERGRRTLILTTHFLDEADLLADHIAILSKGTLRAEGSSVKLKDSLGGGYRVHLQKHADRRETPNVVGIRKKVGLDQITYVAESSAQAAAIIKELERNGISDYGFSGPTIEDVFLQLAEEIKDEEAFGDTTRAKEFRDKMSEESDSEKPERRTALELLDGKLVSYFQQAIILFRKRLIVLRRSWLPILIAFVLPVIAAALTSLFIKGQNPPGCSPADQASSSNTEDAFTQDSDDSDPVNFLAGPSSRLNLATVIRLARPLFQGSGGNNSSGGDAATQALSNVQLVDTFDQFQQHIRDHRENVTTGFWLGDSSTPPTLAYVANIFFTSPLTAQQFLDMLLTNTTIASSWSPFSTPFSPQTGHSLNLVIYMGLALACFPGFFALYPSTERRRFVRGLQYSNGVHPLPLWMAYLLFDFSIALVSAAIVTGVWAGTSSIWYHIEYVFAVLFLYGLASILMAYVVSLFTKSQLATYAFATAIQAICFLAYLIAYLTINTYVRAGKIDQSLHIAHFVISAIAPIGSATRALFLALNLFSSSCSGTKLASYPGGILLYGSPILYLVVQSLALFGLLLWLDSGSAGSSIRGLFSRDRAKEEHSEATDKEIEDELNHATSQGKHEDGLRVLHLTKTFKRNIAIDNVTFGIKRGEVFALLGPNGAGKSTTISLIRGDIKADRNGGDIFVEDASVGQDLFAARANLGVCPQIDAMDLLTVKEHLEFYARIRGVPDVDHNVAAVLRAVGLGAFTSRIASALSGGNKRKLSLGIALMGNPAVVLLDEPSSGLDAAAKRIMWRTLADTVHGRSILLTTHSMEEADALAGRAGIMARRMLALGSPDELRTRFGDALHVHLVATSAPRTTEEESALILDWIRATFDDVTVDSKTYHGQMRFSVSPRSVMAASSQLLGQSSVRERADDPDRIAKSGGENSRSAVGRLAVMLEEQKTALGISHYSVSPTTLDQVFLTIVGQHNVREENYEEVGRKSSWRSLLRRSKN